MTGTRTASRLIGTAVLGGILLLAGTCAGWARCERSDYSAMPHRNSRSDVRMTASSGKECVIRLSASRRVTVVARRIAIAPEHGKATLEGESVFYRSFPGYRGPDNFTAEIEGHGSDGDGVAIVAVQVSVED
jgi:hypothetical protein